MNKVTIIFFLLFFVSCTTEEITTRPYPRLRTLGVTNITSLGVTFHAEIISTGADIIDHGFLWLDQSSPTFDNGDRISLGPRATSGHFESLCERGMAKGKKYYVRSFVVTADNIVYSYPVEFVSQGSKPPMMTDFYPSLASWGDTITLVGQNLSSVPAKTLVKFNGAQATVTSATSTELKVKVPYEILDELTRISISAAGVTTDVSTVPKDFQLQAPSIEAITPSSGDVNTTVVITGKFLNSTRVAVYFNNRAASITNLKVGSITCTVPPLLPAGQTQLKVVTGNGNLFTTNSFEIL